MADDPQAAAAIDNLLAQAQRLAAGPMSPQVQQQLVQLIARARQAFAAEEQAEDAQPAPGPHTLPQQGGGMQRGQTYRM